MKLQQKIINHIAKLSLLVLLASVGSSAWAVNNSLSFDGTDDHVSVADHNDLNLKDVITISTWVYLDSAPAFWTRLVGKGINTTITYGLWLSNSRQLLWQTSGETAGAGVSLTSSSVLSLNTWHHIVVTKSGSVATIYIDGEAENTTESYSGNSKTSSEPLTIGGSPDMNDMFNGKIDEVAIWSSSLTSTEITALYGGTAGTAGTGTPLSAASDSGNYVSSANLVAYYTMDSNSGTGTSLADDSTNSNTGTLTNMVTSGASTDWTAFNATQSLTSAGVAEGGTTHQYTIKLNQEPTSDVTVTLTNSDSGAVSLATSSLTFTPSNWSVAQTVVITGIPDDDATDESVTISHSLSGGGYTGASVPNVTVTVTDDDTQALTLSAASATIGEASSSTYTVKLATQPTGTVTVALSSNDTTAASVSPSSLTFTTSDWNTPQTVTVAGVNDNDATGESVTISNSASGGDYGSVSSSFTATMTDDDAVGITQSATSGTIGEANTGTYTVVLNTQPTGTVTVTPSSSDTGAATVSAAMTFTTGNWSTPQVITVTGVNDADENNESVTISHTISGGDYGSVTMTNYTATITDDDDLTAPTMTITASGASSVADGATTEDSTLTMTFTSNEATTNFVVGDITVANGTLSSFSATSSTVYTAILTPTKEGTEVTVDVAAGAFTDAASNNNDAATQFNWTYLSSPINKTDVVASVKAMSGVAIDAVAMNFNAVEHRVSWLHANVGSNKLSHQGVRLNFANPTVNKLMNTAYVKPGKLDLSNEFVKLIRNNIKDGEAPEATAITDDTKQGLSSVGFNEFAKVREDTIDKVLNATGDTKVMGDWNVWTEGRITVGKTYKTDTSAAQDSQTQNLSLGFDRIIKDNNNSDSNPNASGHIIGVVLGIGKSDADTTNNSTVDADSYSLSAYGVIRQDDKALAQAMMGYGHIKVDKSRIDGSDTLTGAHDANQFFTSIKVQKETIGVGSFSLSPYGKIHASRTWYDGYSETGGATALTYGKQTIDSTVLSAGLDVDYLIPIHKGNIRPFMQFEYGADVSGSSTVVMHYNNEATNYQLELDNKADSNWKFVLGSDFYTEDEWDSSISYERTEAVNAGYSDSLAVKVGLRF